MPTWYTRPVLFVAELSRSLHFYLDLLGFEKAWHEADGKGSVCQVQRGGCEIILCEDAGRRDRGRLFISLAPVALAEWTNEMAQRSIPSEKSWWGYDVIRVSDPDGNELLFPLPAT